ncbi:S49 family peptidase [Alkalimonas sp. NCh-2]|uniref:S49 family peptidase n=1 Tax=Alkalimonas sp. NCh-2 TaxID=3144846 RepID=UPI0031F69AC7
MPRLINFPHIAAMVFGSPLYATPELVMAVKSVLEPRLLGQIAGDIELSEMDGAQMGRDEERQLRGVTITGNLAIIPVHGILVARRGAINAACEELLSYEKLRDQITGAMNHELVKEVVLDFHTGGGQAIGCKETADFIRACTKIKPITALVNYAAYSAGYYLASACSRIIASPTAGVGSIGVIIETYEVSKWEETVGIKYNTFYRGAHKNDMSPHEEITDQAVAEIEKRLDQAYEGFVNSVASYRKLKPEAVMDTQAKLYSAEEALQLKLIDEIAPAQEAINSIALQYVSSNRSRSIRAQAAAINTSLML